MGKTDWFTIEAKADNQTKIYIYSDIGEWEEAGDVSARAFSRALDQVDSSEIEIRMNSRGGSFYDGVSIMNALRQHKAKVTVHVDGMAASAASIVAMAGDKVIMNRGSQMMVHKAKGGVMGGAELMRSAAERLQKIDASMAEIYAERAGGTVEDWRAAMESETWFSASEAVEAGLADEIDQSPDPGEAAKVAASFDLSPFRFQGRAAAPQPVAIAKASPPITPAASVDGQTKQEGQDMGTLMDNLRAKLGIADESADEATVLAALDEALAEQTEPPPSPQASAAEPKDLNQLKELAKASGAVILDSGVWEEAQAKMQEGVNAARKLREQERDIILDRAVEDGRIPPANRGYWASLYDKDPKGTGDVIASLKKNLIPVAAMGYAIESDSDDWGEFASLFPPKGA